MKPTAIAAAALVALGLAACSADVASDSATSAPMASEAPEAVQEGPLPEFYSYDGWIGRWTGVEGMYLDVQTAGDGTYNLEMQWDLDHSGTFTGVGTAGGITFERDGETLTLDDTDGAATGLKHLDGKQDCLTVRAGEGYCRD